MNCRTCVCFAANRVEASAVKSAYLVRRKTAPCLSWLFYCIAKRTVEIPHQ